jgi:choline transport protein
MSLNTEIRPADHTSLDQMQEDKTAVQLKGGTYEDEREMARMGKTQELRVWCPTWSCKFLLDADFSQRSFRFIGIVGFVSILQSTWENALLASYFGLFNGGTAGIIYCTITVWLFMVCMIASM